MSNLMFSRIFKLDAISVSLQLLLAAIMVATNYAAVPGLISYQGRLTNAAGNPVPDGAYFIRFQIYDAPAAGTSLWNSGIQAVQVSNGTYVYILGQDVPLPDGLFTKGDCWLGITVGVDPELTPRRQFLTTAHAFVSQNADSVEWSGIKNLPAGFADAVDNNSGGDITAVNSSGGLTGGATSGDANLSIATGGVTSAHIANNSIVDADVSASANIAASKISGTAATLGALNVFSSTNTFGSGLQICDSTFQADCNGIMIGRDATPSANFLLQVRRNYNTSPSRYGLYTNLENTGTGIVVGNYSRAAAATAGDAGSGTVYASYSISESDDASRYGSYSNCSARTSTLNTGATYGNFSIGADGEEAYGVYGRGTSAYFSYGVYGQATSAAVTAFGVYGHALNNTSNAIGVYGYADNTTPDATGVYGIARGGSAYGSGVRGIAENNSGNGYGVYGSASGNGVDWAGYFNGDVNVTGTLFMPAKITEIDHPLDPENQTLRLAGVDSPEMKAIYDGTVTTDGNGEATVVLPAYFDRLLTDFRYQLTVIGEFAQAIVARKIENGRFVIRTEKPNLEVCWQVTGNRNDAYAVANPLKVEMAKRTEERGLYLQPAAHGLGAGRGVEVLREPMRDLATPKHEPKPQSELEE